ncbi:MAG: ATP-binding protein, partial [Myxococcales bacterium]
FAELFGYANRDELLGKNGFLDLLSAESMSALRSPPEAAAPGSVEVVGVRKDGSRFPGETQAREIEFQGRASRVVAMRDVTERKRAEHERETLEQKLAQAQRLESVGRLAAGVAHDFNNLLTCVMGNASLMKQMLPPGDPSLELVDEVAEAADKAGQLTRQLLAVGRQEHAQPIKLDPNRVIDGIRAMLARVVGERVRLEVVRASPLPAVLIDPGQLERILVNLCVNARDAMPNGGRLEIRTDVARPTDETVRGLGEAPAVDFVRIVVSDSGTGMPKEVLDRIFEPFFTTKKPDKGTGLGLASVHGIVTQNRGFVRVESEVGVGTRFAVCFPRAAD